MADQAPNAVVTLRNEVSPWLMVLQGSDGWDLPDYEPGQFASLGCSALHLAAPLQNPKT